MALVTLKPSGCPLLWILNPKYNITLSIMDAEYHHSMLAALTPFSIPILFQTQLRQF